jgi:signal transduction histidine kinase
MEDFLRKIPLFQGLSDDDFTYLSRITETVTLEPEEELFVEGSLGDRAYIIQDGFLEVFKLSSGREVLLDSHGVGGVIGEMSLLEQKPRMASVRARDKTTLLSIHQAAFDHLIGTSTGAARAMLDIVLTRMRNTESKLQQSEKMAQLGTLTAGVAHELNNPAAAVKRASAHLRQTLAEFATSHSALDNLGLSAEQQAMTEKIQAQIRDIILHPPNLTSIMRSDLESNIEDLLDEHAIDEPWEYASVLVNMNYQSEDTEALIEQFEADHLIVILDWIRATYDSYILLEEIGQGASQISEIVKALKSYAYLDQAAVLAVDVHEGLDSTLIIMRNKLKSGVTINREYATDLPKIQAYGSELNQVWTNLIHNAVDAMESLTEPTITIRTRHEINEKQVVVEIEDNGSGIPDEIIARVFDPFFTTKGPGVGTGMGLHISYNIIVQKHHGDLRVYSEPGKTCFQAWLPVE